ncbi:homocysteine methyltransferase [Polychaeton citri CBS 116435]|uniref:Homocysteine methyltransferase n=1 Tax=Polychaeton citri CBS 116435 TaxID=1314669 RepID=A0A9P4UQ99_9PEZI|nr:homocysteine methyltransferase [Polychaeton citri CBS 116435]
MVTIEQFNTLLSISPNNTLILDGGLATELETRGQDLSHPLWSGKILQQDPESIYRAHRDYFAAGARIAITASYQADTPGLQKHLGLDESEGKQLIELSVKLAQRARDDVAPSPDGELLVAGSVGPYGAYLADGSEYTGAYSLSQTEMQNFHRPRIQALVSAGADLLAVETIPNVHEAEAILSLLRTEFRGSLCWLSCTLAPSGLAICDGTPLTELARLVDGYRDVAVAVGVNCVPPGLVTTALKELKQGTELPLVAYPNSGEEWDSKQRAWREGKGGEGDVDVEWRRLAQLVGGCCRTGPEHIGRYAREARR